MLRPCGLTLRTAARWLSHHRASPLLVEPTSLAGELKPKMAVPVRYSYFAPHNSGLGSTGSGLLEDEYRRTRAMQAVAQGECVLTALQQRRGFLSVGDGDEENDLGRHHEEELVIGYSPEQLYAVVAAVDMYEDFVPWCQRSTVLKHKEDQYLEAELQIGFKFFVERYISHVELKKPTFVKIVRADHGLEGNSISHKPPQDMMTTSVVTTVSQSNLFDYLTNVWEFRPGPTPQTTKLHFLVEFQFRSPLYRKVANMFFSEVAQRLVSSFESRCRAVYGPTMEERQEQEQEQQKKHSHTKNC